MVETSAQSGLWPSIYQPFVRAGARLSEWLNPVSEASSDKSNYSIFVELPGVLEKDISLEVQDGVITLKGEKRERSEKKGETWYFSERSYGSFSRSFRLPPDADDGNVSATLEDGVLTVTVPRLPAGTGKTSVKISRQ